MPIAKKKRKTPLNEGRIKLGFLTVLLVVIMPVLLLAARQTTEDRQHASFENLNTGDQITSTVNADGSMGPANWTENFSNAFNEAQRGNLTFLVTDPSQGQQFPSTKEGDQNNTHQSQLGVIQGGPVAVSSLLLTTPKVEVHMSYMGIPTNDTPTLSVTPTDKWEVLNIGTQKTFDLVQLAKGNLATLGITKLVAGRYTEIRMYIATASALLSDRTLIPLIISGHSNIIRVNQPFTISAGVNTNLTMDLDAQNSVIKRGNQYFLEPVVANLVETKSTLP